MYGCVSRWALGEEDTFFAHPDAEALLQAAVLALVPVVLVDLTLPVGPGDTLNSHEWVSRFRMPTGWQLFQRLFSDDGQHKLNNRVFVWLLTPNTGS